MNPQEGRGVFQFFKEDIVTYTTSSSYFRLHSIPFDDIISLGILVFFFFCNHYDKSQVYSKNNVSRK